MSLNPPDRTTRNDIMNVLMPFFNLKEQRTQILTNALSDAPNLLSQIDYGSGARVFTGNLLTVLLRYGTIDGRHALLYVLDEVEMLGGGDVQAKIAEIKQSLGDDTPTSAAPQTPSSQSSPKGGNQTFNFGGNITATNLSIGGTQTINKGETTSPPQPIPTSSAPATSSPTSAKRDQVFISYSHKETEWMKELMTSLKLRMRYGSISVWNDEQIKAGDRWRDEINNALAAARVAVLLVSRNFLASSFIMDKELPVILSAAESQDLRVIWVPVTYSGVKHTEIYEFQAAGSPLLSPSKTLDSLSEAEKNQAIERVADEIMDAYNAFDA